jgi:hypothetical protein
MSVIDLKAQMEQLAALQASINKQKIAATTQLRSAIEDKVIELNNLIFDFNQVSDGGGFKDVTLQEAGCTVIKARGVRNGHYAGNSQAVCPICVVRGHDARSHKNQTEKRKFTADKLVALGLAPKIEAAE